MTCEYTVERAAANLPQSTQSPIFTVSGGRVLLLAIVPEVATAIQNQSNSTSVYVNPAVGSDVQIWNIGSIEDQQAGQLFGLAWQGTGGLTKDVTVDPFPPEPIVVPVGTIDLACAASSTGQLKWVLLYRPLDPGAYVAAA
jgi:hypothetical protein